MTIPVISLICLGGMAFCATLIFAVETLVAFCFHHDQVEAQVVSASLQSVEDSTFYVEEKTAA